MHYNKVAAGVTVIFDVAYRSERPLMAPTLYSVMIMVKEVAHYQPVSCSSSLKDPVQHMWPLGVALKYIWLHITSVCVFDNTDTFYMTI